MQVASRSESANALENITAERGNSIETSPTLEDTYF